MIIYVLVSPLPTQTFSEDPENPVKLKNRWPRCPWSLVTATDWSHHQQVPLCPLHPPSTTAALLHSQSPAPASWMFPLMQIQAIFVLIWILYWSEGSTALHRSIGVFGMEKVKMSSMFKGKQKKLKELSKQIHTHTHPPPKPTNQPTLASPGTE